MTTRRRALLFTGLAAVAVVLVVGLPAAVGWFSALSGEQQTIKVGILHSMTGTMAVSERPLVDAARLAIDELNAAGGVLGRRIEPIVADGRSDPATFGREAERLIAAERVAAVFGVWTSASRRTVTPIFERHDHLLFYPLQYEGLEESPAVVYLGAAPNQQIVPAVRWAVGNIGRRFVLVGSDYVFPRAANAIIREQVRRWRGEILAEVYLPLGSRDVGPIVREIQRVQPDAILNTLNGDSNIAFFTEMRAAGITPAQVPTISFSIAEEELRWLPTELMVGDYAAWSYFQSIDNAANQRFVREFRRRYGAGRVTSDPIEMAYTAPHIWAAAAESAGTVEAAVVRRELADRSFRTPGGMIHIDAQNHHAWKPIRIGRMRADGQFDIVWSSERPIRPEPFPALRTREEWTMFLGDLNKRWGGQWVSPASTVSFYYTDPEAGARLARRAAPPAAPAAPR